MRDETSEGKDGEKLLSGLEGHEVAVGTNVRGVPRSGGEESMVWEIQECASYTSISCGGRGLWTMDEG